MANYNLTVECTYTFDVAIEAPSKKRAIEIATTEMLEDMTTEDMKLVSAKAKNVVKLINIDDDYDNK